MADAKRKPRFDQAHTQDGAPRDKAHEQVGDGTLIGAVPAGLSPDEMKRRARQGDLVEPGTG